MAEKMRYNKIIDLLEHGKPVFSTSTVPNGSLDDLTYIADADYDLRDILRQVRGIGAIWAGPGDMSVSMGLRGQADHPAVQENLLRVLAACKEFGVPCATGATADDVAMRLEQGFRIIMTAPVRSTPGLVEGRRLAAR
jgi:HpcH/HpaI aldolase/citrate lyase family protein